MTSQQFDKARDPGRGDPVVEIRTTCPDRAAAEACAALLVNGRFAACVQVEGPVFATYRWQGHVETATEWRCTCKTTASRATACREAIVRSHTYETPEILAIEVDASAAYAAWVRSVVAEPP